MHEILGLPASMAFVAALGEFLGGLGLIAGCSAVSRQSASPSAF
jgi:hypothetical protein